MPLQWSFKEPNMLFSSGWYSESIHSRDKIFTTHLRVYQRDSRLKYGYSSQKGSSQNNARSLPSGTYLRVTLNWVFLEKMHFAVQNNQGLYQLFINTAEYFYNTKCMKGATMVNAIEKFKVTFYTGKGPKWIYMAVIYTNCVHCCAIVDTFMHTYASFT